MADSFLTELLTSKKVVAAVTGVLTVVVVKVAGKFGLVLDTDTANQVSMLVGGITSAYLLGQGVADINKSAVVEALNAGANPNHVITTVLGNKTSLGTPEVKSGNVATGEVKA